MEFYPVDEIVNNPAKDFPACIAPLPLRRPATELKAGNLVRVQHCEHAYRLPEGLEPGTLVRLIARDTGYWTVEANGRCWTVSITNVVPGDEYYVAGEWWHESHPIARQEMARLAKWRRGGNSVLV